MRPLKSAIAGIVLLVASTCLAQAQTQPGWSFGFAPTPAQWNAAFGNKQDYLGAPPLLTTGGTMTGPLITAASLTSNAGFNLPPGTAPTSPNNGDVWETTTSIFVRINGTTYDLLNGACSICAVTNAANTFTASPQTVQGLTTTSPGWYAQLTGDTQARVRIGLNSTDVPSIAFGPGNAVRDTFIERAAAATVRLGSPDAASPVAQTLGVQNVIAGTSNTAGAALTIDGSRGTGSGAGGNILFKVAPAGSSGTAQNALSTALSIFGADGGLSTGAAIDEGAGTLNLAGGLYNNGTAPVGTGGYVRGASAVTTINTVACTIGSSCSISAAAANVVGTSAVTGTGRQTNGILYDSAGTLAEYSVVGSGTAALLATSPTIQTNLNINGTSHGGSEGLLTALDASMVATNSVVATLGLDNSNANNSANWSFSYTSTGNANNHGCVGLFGNNQIACWDGNQNFGVGTGSSSLDKAFTVRSDNNFSVDTSGNQFMAGSITNTTAANFIMQAASSQQLVLQSNGASNSFVFNSSGAVFYPAPTGTISIGNSAAKWTNGWFTSYVVTATTVIASLGSCSATNTGAHWAVSNGVSSPTLGATVSATGSTGQAVWCNGTNWVYGELAPANDNVPAYLSRKFA